LFDSPARRRPKATKQLLTQQTEHDKVQLMKAILRLHRNSIHLGDLEF